MSIAWQAHEYKWKRKEIFLCRANTGFDTPKHFFFSSCFFWWRFGNLQCFSSVASSQEAAKKWPKAEAIRISELFLLSWTDTEVGLIPWAVFVQAVPLMQTENVQEQRWAEVQKNVSVLPDHRLVADALELLGLWPLSFPTLVSLFSLFDRRINARTLSGKSPRTWDRMQREFLFFKYVCWIYG